VILVVCGEIRVKAVVFGETRRRSIAWRSVEERVLRARERLAQR
jgi:hypothetical protein